MSEKTITIDSDAYKRLKGIQRKNESMSDTIRRVAFDPGKFWASIKRWEDHPLTDDAVAAVEDAIAARIGAPRKRSKRK